MKKIFKELLLILVLVALASETTLAQFGQNKVQYRSSEWFFIQTKHFDIYFNQEGAKIAEFGAKAAEEALASIQKKLNYAINNRISFILYNSQNEFQETNVTDEYLTEGIGGFTELIKNRVVLPFTGNYKAFRHVIHHELVHAVMNDMFYGGSIQNAISNNITVRIPLWFAEGLAEYLSLGWDVNTDMYIRDAVSSELLPDINRLDGYFAYRGGQALFYYLAEKYGEEKIGEIVNKAKSKASVEEGILASTGLKLEDLNERWKKFLKRRYWPDIKEYQDPDEFGKRLTNHRKDGGFYNTSPAISPQGDKVAFISNRDIFFDVYIMNAQDGKIIKKIVEGNRTSDFEDLNILTPGLTWSPKGDKIALAAKSAGWDVIYIINVEDEDVETLPLKMAGIGSVHWSPDGKYLAFGAQNNRGSDIYTYSFESREVTNVTNDLYSDADPVWSPDSKAIFFVSDRGDRVEREGFHTTMTEHNYRQNDIYSIRLEDKTISRLSSTETADESSPAIASDGKDLLFISDANGINNMYKLRLNARYQAEQGASPIPVSNSLNGVYQLSVSNDGKKLVFSSMYQSAFDIFSLTNPLEVKLKVKDLKKTDYVLELTAPDTTSVKINTTERAAVKDSSVTSLDFFTGQFVDTLKTKPDSAKKDLSNFIFGESNYYKVTKAKDTTKFALVDNLDDAGNYKKNRYKVSFSPDIIYANAGFNTLYGLVGTTVLSFSDVLGNHRLIGQTSLQIDLKNSDYGLAYLYLPSRWNFSMQGFHTARFVFLERFGELNYFRFRNYGMAVAMSYPFSRYYRVEGGINYFRLTADNLDNPDDSFEKAEYLLPSVAFVHDNTIFGYTAPIEGTRYRFDVLGNPSMRSNWPGFYSITGDYRKYFRFFTDYSFAVRFSGGFSRGANAQKFFIGGTENWINRRFATVNVPLGSTSDFAFLTAVLPMRGYDYAERLGSTYGLANMEFRFPLIRYLLTGGLPLLFRDVIGVAFLDAGSAWEKNKDLQLFTNDPKRGFVTKDLLLGTGIGARMYLLYFLARFDVAWAYDMNAFSRPVFYFSLGADF